MVVEGAPLNSSSLTPELLTAVESDPSKGSEGASSNAGKGRAIEEYWEMS